MAKRRVFELARELNMNNKELLDKIREMDIEVSSHLSSLEEDTVNHVKNHIFGAKKAAEVEDTRVRPNVIRRRRKAGAESRTEAGKAQQQPEQSAAPEAEKPEAQQETPEVRTAEPEEQAPEETAAAPSAAGEAKAGQPEEKAAEPEAEQAQEAPAEPGEISRETAAEETQTAGPPAEETPDAEPAGEAADQQPEAGAPEQPSAESESRSSGAQVSAGEEQPAAEEKPGEAEEKPKKARKKGKKGAPAKIIRMPEPEEKPEARTIEAPEPKSPAPETGAPAEKTAKPATEEEKPRAKKKKRTDAAEPVTETEKAKKPGKKKASFKRKEVVEGDALYDNRFGRAKKGKKKGKATRPATEQKPQATTPKAIKRRIKIDETVVLSDLAKRMGIKGNELIKRLMEMGMMVTLNQSIDFETAELLAAEYSFEVEKASFEEEAVFQSEEDSPEQLEYRPPVVTIMGHVDHGKTSLLDVIRHSKITEKEAGGITQHIGAYRVPYENGDIIFLDTPGHEAFTAMRSRGAKVTDLVILVVAADDGVMPQTSEAIDHARAAGVPIIVAINKVDKANADQDKIKRELAEKDLVPEEWGGETICVPVSAKQQSGLDDLLEMVLLQAEVQELKANPNKHARGYIIESKLESGRGPVATVLIREGTLHTGDPVVSGVYYGKVRAMFDDMGKPVKTATPSYPVEIIGLSGVPAAGDELIAVDDEKTAKQVSEHRLEKQRSKDLSKTTRMSLESLYEKMQEGEVRDLNLIIKADVQGSIEALKDSLTRLSTDEVKVNVVHSAAGAIHESDISLAAVSNAIILGFNVRPSAKVSHLAEEESVDIRYYNVIYNAIQEIKDAMVGMMSSTYEERVLGRAEVRQVFSVPSMGTVAGCMVLEGKIQRGQPIRLIRDGIVVHEGKLASLKRYKDDVREVTHNYECGMGIERFNDIKIGDIIECYYLEEIKPVIE
ncbi:MAG: translation initiation factor IF-2 [Desulfobacteraceae bacterium]|nr:translation initiation factor IF-2 [Desulfobacteraceae bacterium]